MITLKFGTATANDGFTTYNTASFNDMPPAQIIRELIQNSLDAAKEAGEPTAKIRFSVNPMTPRDLPDLKGYEKAFRSAVQYQQEIHQGQIPDAAQEVIDRIDQGLADVKAGKASILSITDNGIGLNVASMNSMLADGASVKSSAAAGSYGIGHHAPVALSNLRYIIYAGLNPDGKRIVSGKTILATHTAGKGQFPKDAKGYLIREFQNTASPDGNLYHFPNETEQPNLATQHLDAISKDQGHGCAIIIPAYNNFGNPEKTLWEIVSKVAAYNFAPAIYDGNLAVTVAEDDKTTELNIPQMESILNHEKDAAKAARSDSFYGKLRPSGQNAYSIMKTITEGKSYNAAVRGSQAKINLLLSPPNGKTRIDVFRNGMWITDRIPSLSPAGFADRKPFHAIINLNAEEGKELHRLIRKAEGPMHDRLDLKLLARTEQETLKEALAEIAARIREQTPEVSTEEYTVDDFLMVDTGKTDVKGNKISYSWGAPAAVSRHSIAQMQSPPEADDDQRNTRPDPGNTGKNSRSKNTSKQKTTHPMPFRSTIIPAGKGKCVGSIRSPQNLKDIRLTLRVDENQDFTCDRIWPDENLTLKSFSITPPNGEKIPQCQIVDDGRFAKIQGLVAGAAYEIRLEYDAPLDLTNVVDQPILRLEMHRPPSTGNSRNTAATETPTEAHPPNANL